MIEIHTFDTQAIKADHRFWCNAKRKGGDARKYKIEIKFVVFCRTFHHACSLFIPRLEKSCVATGNRAPAPDIHNDPTHINQKHKKFSGPQPVYRLSS